MTDSSSLPVVPPPPVAPPLPSPPEKDGFERAFKLWCKYEDVTMHFNDLILRLRFQALAGVAGISAVVGVFGHDVEDASVRSAVLSGVFLLLAFFWSAIWALDRFYYDKLLTGAVHSLLFPAPSRGDDPSWKLPDRD